LSQANQLAIIAHKLQKSCDLNPGVIGKIISAR
jgi:hypothetical protein